MAIILSSQTNVYSENVVGNALGSFGETLGIPGFPNSGGTGKATSDILAVQDKMNSVFNKLLGRSSEVFDPNFVESGRQVAIGSGIEGGKGPNIETANTRKVYTQTPQASILIKKRAFSSLQDLYNPAYMDPAEKWLIRATKRLVARKCKIMSDYERLTKIEKLVDAGAATSVILTSLISSGQEESGDDTTFSSMIEFQNVVFDRQPVKTTTYFVDSDMPFLEELGTGSGVFELTAVATLNTSLGLEGDGSFSMNIEDPYRILFITEEDIETAIRETALSGISNQLDTIAGQALNTAQSMDSMLAKHRRERGKSEITINVGLNFGSGVNAIIDVIGLQINSNNLDDIPEEQALDSTEQRLFLSTISNLKIYQESISKRLLMGIDLDKQIEEIRAQMTYARNKLRLFYLGKSLIQPMDTINIFIDGGTRRGGECEDIENTDILSFKGAVNFAANALGLRTTAIDDDLLLNEWRRAGEFPDFETFKKLRTLSLSTESGVHVFGGFVNQVVDQFNADSGSYNISVSGTSNMGWLDISRYNAQPSLDQTQGVMYDPMTPFDIKTDKATGLPIGNVKLSAANQQMLKQGCYYFNTGPNIGKKLEDTKDMKQDVLVIGNNIINLYQHAPGLVYKWKEGIMTATYNSSTTNPLDGSLSTLSQLRRDVGFFASNTPFDNMDAANVLSTLITGMPYNAATFIQSALNTGAYNPDTTLNSGKDYFHSILSMQKSNTKANGGFVPFKSITIDPLDLARSIYYQRKIFDKSYELSQLRNQEAKLKDQILNISKNLNDPSLKDGLGVKLNSLTEKINNMATDLSELSKGQQELGKNLIVVAGNDISFDLESITNNEEYKLFGDKLAFAVLRRREDVIRNKDKNYFIVSDEYDKDYDIQAFVLKLRERAPDMWKSSWQPVRQLCKQVAETLDFEFFCSSQGHIVFRPPQYNRTPRTLLEQMLLLNRTGGIKLFPDFLTSLFQTREQALFSQIEMIEWEIRMNFALLGKNSTQDISSTIIGKTGAYFEFLTNNGSSLAAIIDANLPLNPQEKKQLGDLIKTLNSSTQLMVSGSGLFDAISQINLQNEIINRTTNTENIGNKSAYDNAIKNLSTLTGNPLRTYLEYDKAKVGATKNGISTPASDVARIVSNIESLISQRSKLIRSLGKMLEQSIEITTLSEGGESSVSKTTTNVDELPSGISEKLIEDDRKDYLGHMSGDRFIIKDESIYECSFTEAPPEMTICTIQGSQAIVGESGGMAGMPVFTAFGVDFDLWRQYGFRSDKTIDKPFFSSADYQCAPYAVMLLSRQRKNIVTGTATVVGNEFYQLGDVVYVAHRQMLYYVTKISHTFGYNGDFKTTLELKYGHPPGQYIPTPLDLIGKMQVTKGNSQGSYRIRRETPQLDALIGTVVFSPPDSNDIFVGKHSKRNYEQLVNALTIAQTEIDKTKPLTSPRLYCMTFFGESSVQQSRCKSVQKWLSNPVKPGAAMGGQGVNGVGGGLSNTVSKFGGSTDVGKYRIDPGLIKIQTVSQDYPTDDDKILLSQGIIASQETFVLDPPFFGVVEIRLRQPPIGGWTNE
ncbi:MAG: hypothetical protein WC516_08195 [Patescibacteria group bacterium]|jgi:hypothetical protein